MAAITPVGTDRVPSAHATLLVLTSMLGCGDDGRGDDGVATGLDGLEGIDSQQPVVKPHVSPRAGIFVEG